MWYWQWHGGIHLDQGGKVSLGYWQMTVDLDQLFEMYVGEVWNASIGKDFEWTSSPEYDYKIDNFDNTFSDRKIIPDHLFLHRGYINNCGCKI
jgi:hypothetical protein